MDLSRTFLSMFTKFRSYGRFLELAKNPRRLAVELAKFFVKTGFIVPTVKMVQGSSKFLCMWHLAGYPTGCQCHICNMDGFYRAALGVRLKLGQKLQGEKFEISQIHS